ncbi:VRR-NUC domain-containing protein [Clostridium botulinum]|nr:VRR-NUC domain-containing protein [Clostridium botulinum]NFN14890.1 VRR-NUC domain-containing protein [Clostridium botulinum]NFN22658.1 VRR-NUC domain-containing protein [Clostridium botulinum]NFN43332.1 VRR-NUC domain-containing protein [Clostridium botulinum]
MAAEKQFENKIKKFMISIGIYPAGHPKHKMTVSQVGWFFKHWAGPYSVAGIPDIICCIKGRFVGLEIKAEGGHPSALQLRTVDLINASGGVAIIVYPKDLEELQDLLIGLANG